MLVTVEFGVPAEQFLLGDTLPAFPDAVVEGEWLIPTEIGVCPYLWVTDAPLEEFERRGRADSTVEYLELQAELDDGGLFAVEWALLEDSFARYVVEASGVVLEFEGDAERWGVKMRFPDRTDASELSEASEVYGVPLCIERVQEVTTPKVAQYNVTPKQREMLVLALERGYYEMPRRVTMEELADELGISTGAASERFRRGLTNLVSSSLTIGHAMSTGVE